MGIGLRPGELRLEVGDSRFEDVSPSNSDSGTEIRGFVILWTKVRMAGDCVDAVSTTCYVVAQKLG